ncbi:MAG: hypothetical protein K2P58_00145 [Hyphomonadaceae bacterium]|nr:hypothetical protein [Hyphomonadaceae bacterium]
MTTPPPSDASHDADLLMERARLGGPDAAAAARRAAALTEPHDRERAREALSIALRLEPLDPAPRLALARLAAEDGELDVACREAEAVLRDAVDKAAQARAAYLLGEITRLRGDASAAREHYEKTLHIEDAILKLNRSEAAAVRWYARARGRLAELDAEDGMRERALTGAEGALAMLRASAAALGEAPVLAADIADAEARLAGLELDAGQAMSARRRLGEAIARYEALAVTEKDEPHWRSALADAWSLAAEADFVRGAAEDARTAMDKALHARLRLAAKHGDEVWALAGVWRKRAALLEALGDTASAAQSLEQACALAGKLVERAEHPQAPTRFLVHTLLERADQALRTQALDVAQAAANEALARAEPFARAEGAEAAWLTEAGACWDRLAEIARKAGANHQAREACARSVEFFRMGLDRQSEHPRQMLNLSAALLKLGDVALAIGGNAEARASFQESANLRAQLSAASPDAASLHAYATALERVGLAAAAQADWMAARQAWLHELSLADRIFDDAEAPEALRFRAIVESHLAGLKSSEAQQYRRAALVRLRQLERMRNLSPADAALKRRLELGA